MLIASFFWALRHPLGKIIVKTVHPFQLGTGTLVTGFFGLLVFLVITGRIKAIKKIPLKDILLSLGLGVFGFFLYQVFVFSALERITSSMNAVLISVNVVFISILSYIILKEKIKIAGIIGIILAFIGVVLVTFNNGFSDVEGFNIIDIPGVVFSLLAALSFALYSVLGKKILKRNDPLIVTAISLFSGTTLLAIFTAGTVGYSGLFSSGWYNLLLIAILGLTVTAIAYPLWFTCLKNLPASHVSIYIYITPVFAVIISLVVLKEFFSWLFWVGSALIIAGIIITNRFSSAAPGSIDRALKKDSANR